MPSTPLTPDQQAAIQAQLRPGDRAEFDARSPYFFIYSDTEVDVDRFPGYRIISVKLELKPAPDAKWPCQLRVLFVAS